MTITITAFERSPDGGNAAATTPHASSPGKSSRPRTCQPLTVREVTAASPIRG